MKKFRTFLKYKKTNFILAFLFSVLITQPAHAYAGPGVAIGALVVFITVILTFFASFFITIFKYIKKLLVLIKNLFTKNRSKKKKQIKKD